MVGAPRDVSDSRRRARAAHARSAPECTRDTRHRAARRPSSRGRAGSRRDMDHRPGERLYRSRETVHLGARRSVHRPRSRMMRGSLFGEFSGTFMMMLLGDCVVAACLLKGTKAEGNGWMVITTAWAFAVLCGIFTANLFGSADAHLNPAITMAFAVKTGDYSRVVPYLLAQGGGSFTAAAAVWLFYYPHWKVTEDPAAKLAVFCTAPAIRSFGFNLFNEIAATFVLVILVGSVTSKLVLNTGAVAGLTPFLVGCLVWAIGLSLGATTGYAINPARDFGPRLAHALLPIAGKGGSDWAYSWVPILGPVIGASLAGGVLRTIGA